MRKKIVRLFTESSIPELIIGYHTTKHENLESILSNGLQINRENMNYTFDDWWVVPAYGLNPVYLAKEKGYYHVGDELKDNVLLEVNCSSLDIGGDLGHLIERGAILTEDGFYFEDSNLFGDREFKFHELTENPDDVSAFIKLTGTFVVMSNIDPKRIKEVF
jgi:hypothetical protein